MPVATRSSCAHLAHRPVTRSMNMALRSPVSSTSSSPSLSPKIMKRSSPSLSPKTLKLSSSKTAKKPSSAKKEVFQLLSAKKDMPLRSLVQNAGFQYEQGQAFVPITNVEQLAPALALSPLHSILVQPSAGAAFVTADQVPALRSFALSSPLALRHVRKNNAGKDLLKDFHAVYQRVNGWNRRVAAGSKLLYRISDAAIRSGAKIRKSASPFYKPRRSAASSVSSLSSSSSPFTLAATASPFTLAATASPIKKTMSKVAASTSATSSKSSSGFPLSLPAWSFGSLGVGVGLGGMHACAKDYKNFDGYFTRAPNPDNKADTLDPNNCLDIVFAFDTTGSMSSCVDQVRRNVQEMTTRLFTEFQDRIRIGIIAFGDYLDIYDVRALNFTTCIADCVEFLTKDAVATGGGDSDECYELMLHVAASKMSWRSATNRALVVVGDAKAHESTYRNNTAKLDWRLETMALATKSVRVYSVQCLNGGAQETRFYSDMASISNGLHVRLDQFADITNFMMSIVYREFDPNALDQLRRYEDDLRDRNEMNENLKALFDKLTGRNAA